MRVGKWCLAAAVAGAVWWTASMAQSPLPPLPGDVRPVVPAANVVPAKPAAPLDRFLADLKQYPDVTHHALYSVRSGADWLARMNQSDGRFHVGFNPSLSYWLDDDSDARQAAAAVGLARAAAFTGDARFTASAAQAVLALLSLTKLDTGEAVRVPLIAADRGNKVVFAARTVLAVCELPSPDAKLVTKADELCAYLRKFLKPDGSVVAGEDSTPVVPGLICQALMASDRRAPAEWKRQAVANAIAYYRPAFKQTPSPDFAAAMMPAVVDFCLREKSEGGCGFAFEMGDRLCDLQYTANDARNRNWVGGFKFAAGEPTATSLPAAEALAAALHLSAQVPDTTRFARFRVATRDALNFGRGLELTVERTRQFDKNYAQLLVGGVTAGPSDACARAESTADLLAAHVRYLQSGGERGE